MLITSLSQKSLGFLEDEGVGVGLMASSSRVT